MGSFIHTAKQAWHRFLLKIIVIALLQCALCAAGLDLGSKQLLSDGADDGRSVEQGGVDVTVSPTEVADNP